MVNIKSLITTGVLAVVSSVVSANTFNIAREAKTTASSCVPGYEASMANDGLIRINNRGEWRSSAKEMFWGEIDFPWIRLDWDETKNIEKVLIYDASSPTSHVASVRLSFSDGTTINAGPMPTDGSPLEVYLGDVRSTFLNIQVTDGTGNDMGLSEIEVFPTAESVGDYVSFVDPMIETTRGRYFFFITGCQPQGMIGAAPLTRNKNQGGGGYNYNDSEILGFPQIHAWMMSGLTFMPVAGDVNLCGGEQAWKSQFLHAGEIARPGYHRVFLEDYGVWVEQTATQRTSFYRLTYTDDCLAQLLFNLGGYVSTSTMVNADVRKVSSTRLEGSFDTTGRLWGGPDRVKVFFVIDFELPFERLDAWDDKNVWQDVSAMKSATVSTARNDGMSYHDAPTAGISAVYPAKSGTPINVKMAVSYTSIENARENLRRESPHWDFDHVCRDATEEWNRWLGNIAVNGGTHEQRVKFYTDLWHTLLGRHKINDCSGDYPDRTTGGRIEGKNVIAPNFLIKKVPLHKEGSPKYNMYNTDALWLTQWNQNTLWGLAWPSLLDDFSASMLQYADNGGLLPRGPSGGGYSFIMSGCPATSMITSAFQRGLCRKFNPAKAYRIMKANHEKGGMLGFNSEKEFNFYVQNGFAPERAGLTVQWTFEDWALSRMALVLGKKRDAAKYEQRSRGWRHCIHPTLRLLLPKRDDGTWLHTDPLNGWGYEEANAWQTTFGISQDIPGLAEAMGGEDSLACMLDSAFRMSRESNFIGSYGRGYVSYGNQPGLSSAHVFSHVGKPWLTQYWVRQVKERAYGATSPFEGYGGHDEDQGQMSGVSALMAIGLFSINGGSDINPSYEITSPVFDKVVIRLDSDYYPGAAFNIVTHNNSADNCYIQKATLNGQPYNSFLLPHKEFVKGGTLELWMGVEPNEEWGVETKQ